MSHSLSRTFNASHTAASGRQLTPSTKPIGSGCRRAVNANQVSPKSARSLADRIEIARRGRCRITAAWKIPAVLTSDPHAASPPSMVPPAPNAPLAQATSPASPTRPQWRAWMRLTLGFTVDPIELSEDLDEPGKPADDREQRDEGHAVRRRARPPVDEAAEDGPRGDRPAELEGERAIAGEPHKRGRASHRHPSARALRAASSNKAISDSVCARDTNSASNCDGAIYMPCASIFLKKRANPS